VALDGMGNIIVANHMNNHIQKFTSEGHQLERTAVDLQFSNPLTVMKSSMWSMLGIIRFRFYGSLEMVRDHLKGCGL
jgi:hypothetical protein